MEPELRADVKAYREYLFDTDGCRAGIAFTLEDINAGNGPAQDARQVGASSYGMAFLSTIPGAPARPATWIHLGTVVAVTGDALTDDVRQLFAHCIGQFFADIAPDHPQLAESLHANGMLAAERPPG